MPKANLSSLNGVNLLRMPYIIARARHARARQPPRNRSSGTTGGKAQGKIGMGRLIKLLAGLAVLGFLALTGYAYLSDLSPATQEVKVPVTLHAD